MWENIFILGRHILMYLEVKRQDLGDLFSNGLAKEKYVSCLERDGAVVTICMSLNGSERFMLFVILFFQILLGLNILKIRKKPP